MGRNFFAPRAVYRPVTENLKRRIEMKKIALAIAALSFTAGAAFAENPYVGRTDVIQSGPNAGQEVMDPAVKDLDRGATGSIMNNNNNYNGVPNETREEMANPGANNYGDAAPGSVQYD
jgi:hypothetical protein